MAGQRIAPDVHRVGSRASWQIGFLLIGRLLGLLFGIAFLQVDATRRLPASFVDCSNLFGEESEA